MIAEIYPDRASFQTLPSGFARKTQTDILSSFFLETPTQPPFSAVLVSLPDAKGIMSLGFTGEFYYRIWVFPQILEAQNPRIGDMIPFSIFNAYPWINHMFQIDSVNAQGLKLSIPPDIVFQELEVKSVEIKLEKDAPQEISAEFIFHFAHGKGILYFLASLSALLTLIPDSPILEEWAWMTDIIEAANGLEQRISLRSTPRLNLAINYPVLTSSDWQVGTEILNQYLSQAVMVPQFQYGTELTRGSASGTDEVFFDRDRLDLRAGDNFVVLDEQEEMALLQMKVGIADGVQIKNPLKSPLSKGMRIHPCRLCRLADMSGTSMGALVGSLNTKLDILDRHFPFSNPRFSPIIERVVGLPILDRRPIVLGNVSSSYFMNQKVIDREVGRHNFVVHWESPKFKGMRTFHVSKRHGWGEFEWWRAFLDTLKGRQKPFLLPTWRQDLQLFKAISQGDSKIAIKGVDFGGILFAHPSNRYLRVEENSTISHAHIISTVSDPTTDSTDLLLSDALSDFTTNATVSLMNVCRLDSDTVKLAHSPESIQVTIGIRSLSS